MMKKFILPLLISLTFSTPVLATGNASEASANASATLSMGAASIVVGSVSLLSAGGQFLVESVEKTADGFVYVLGNMSQDLSKAGKISVRVIGNASGNASGAASVLAGQSVQVLTESAGTVIMVSGEIIAFIPNEIGQSLIHHSSLN
jgi:hypothetical protein